MNQELDELAKTFKANVNIQDRKYLLKTFKQCFVGSEAVDFLVKEGHAPTREDAVELGKALQAAGLFEHVTRDHIFADEYLFFRFLNLNERGEFSFDEKTGQKLDWSYFLMPAGFKEAKEGKLQPNVPLPDFEALNSKDTHIASKMWPMDTYNTTLLNHVHPPQWNDPDGSTLYDLVVIGGGTGGLISAAGSAGVGAKVALIEEHMLGGDWYVVCFVCLLWFDVLFLSDFNTKSHACTPCPYLSLSLSLSRL